MAQRRMSKREARDERRFRIEQERLRERRRRARLNLLVIGGSLLVGVVLLGLVFLSIHRRGDIKTPATTPSTVLDASSPAAPGTATVPATGAVSTPASIRATTSPHISGSPVR